MLVTNGTAALAQDAAELSATPPVTITVLDDGNLFANVFGGMRTGEAVQNVLNVQLSIDGGRLLRWPGMTIFVDGMWIRGGQPGAFVGDVQGVSNLTGPSTVRLEEAWLQMNLLRNRLSVLAGRYDLNTEFYRLQSAGLFVNSSFGVGPEFSQSGSAGPSVFPSTAIGSRVAFKPTPNIVLRAAVFDGAPVDRPDGSVAAFKAGDGLLLLAEAAFLKRPRTSEQPPRIRFRIGRASGLPPYDAKFAVGGWYYTATFRDLVEPISHPGSAGGYAIADTVVARVRGDTRRRVTVFGEVGLGDPRVNRVGSYLGAGLVASGVLASRPSDEFGMAVASARNGSPFMQAEQEVGVATHRAETALEATYLSQVAAWLALQPDFQYVIHPGVAPSLGSARVLQLRFEVKF